MAKKKEYNEAYNPVARMASVMEAIDLALKDEKNVIIGEMHIYINTHGNNVSRETREESNE